MRKLRERVCEYCGKVFLTRENNPIYCGLKCFKKSPRRPRCITRCPHNDGVVCNEMMCSKCGWNPEVAQKRKESMANG